MPDEAARSGATPIPKTHLMKLSGEDLHGKLDGERYNCMECHVPQVEIPAPIKNTFKSEFRDKKGKVHSNLSDILNEGVSAE
jgi:cytochrome c-type protein NapB